MRPARLLRERDLLQVIVLDQGNIVAQVLRKLKVDPTSLLPADG